MTQGCTDPGSYGWDCDRSECTDPVGGEHAPSCGPQVDDVVVVVNPESTFHGMHGLVTKRIERTCFVAFPGWGAIGRALPFGVSELERD